MSAMKNIALLFPGQGSQVIGMGKDFYENFNESKLVFEEASDTIKLDIKKICFEGPLESLTLTENLQPALFTTEMAIFKAFQVHIDPNPNLAAGHSLGEYSAIAASGALSIKDGVLLTRARGKAMQEAVPSGVGAMAALLGLSIEQVELLCTESKNQTNEVVEPANFNSNGQIVISGSKKGIDFAMSLLSDEKYKGGKAIPLLVSAPFHCSLMKPAQEIMKPLLEKTKFNKPNFKILTNINAEIIQTESDFPKCLIEQITGSVKWLQSMEKLKNLEIEKCFEIGPGKVLTGLMKRINREMPVESISTVELLKNTKRS